MEIKFPIWKPHRTTKQAFANSDFKRRYKALRNSSSGFIERKDVREYIIKKYDGKCYLCGSSENLQVDHVTSVYRCAVNEYPIDKLNTEENLALICLKCNCSKRP